MKSKILALILGLLFSTIVIEFSFRLIGIPLNSKTAIQKELTSKSYTILCLGNSFTKGDGAPKGESYPDHLQKIFKTQGYPNVQVINEGISNQNTTALLKKLPTLIEKYRPQFIILQTGQANTFNISNYIDYLDKKNIKASFKNRIENFFYHLRVFRFMKYLASVQPEKRIHPTNLETEDFFVTYSSMFIYQDWSQERTEKEILRLKQLIKTGTPSLFHFSLLGNIYLNVLKNEELAIKTYLDGILWEPYLIENPNALLLARLYKKTKSAHIKERINQLKIENEDLSRRFQL